MNEDKLRDYLKWVTADLHETRQKLRRLEQDAVEPVAIVAMSCRFPGGVASPEDFWQLLEAGRDALTEFPADRGWEALNVYDADPDHPGTSYTNVGGFIESASEFDAGFFGISPREALAMDPQQRLLLEATWELFERAAIDPAALRGSATGVYIGSNGQDYSDLFALSSDDVGGYLATGAASSVISGRISYTFGFEGPAVTVDTACSSSLVALHTAIQSLRRGECELAVVGGATVMSSPGLFIEFSRQRGLSADGRCRAFADSADGTGWGEGVGLLLVERLSDARAKGHQVLAVVRGSAVNQDGASNGLTAPNGPSQQRVIRAALASAGLNAADVDVVEAHGTGTSLGDPIEAQALLATYGKHRPEGRPLRLGSVKSNIGHTQAAAGVAGIIKMVEAMRHDVLPKSLHIDTPSTHVDWSSGAIELLTEAQAWPGGDEPRRAGVSSFGISGTNAHVIIEEPWTVEEETTEQTSTAPAEPAATATPTAAPTTEITDSTGTPWILSARTEAALRAQAARLRAFVLEHSAESDLEIGRALVNTRAAHAHRAVVFGADRAELLGGLEALADPTSGTASAPASDLVVTGTAAPGTGKTVFVFPGQGSQWVGMALELLDSSAVFRARIEECEQALAPYVDWSLTAVLRAEPGAPTFERVDVVQPVLFAVMVSLAAEWQSYGVRPSAVVGHSQGEIAAACVAGLISLPDAAKIVALRSLALRELAGRGGMVSVALSPEGVSELIGDLADRISVATLNGPASTAVSGDPEALDELLTRCAAQEIRARRIDVDYASHSAHVDAIRGRVLTELAGLKPQPSQATSVPFYSTVDARYLDSADVAKPEYWFRNLRQTVRFEPVIRDLAETGFAAFVEISAHPVLTLGMQQTLDSVDSDAVVVGTLRRDEGGPARLQTALAELYVHGLSVDWTSRLGAPERADGPLALPTYPFQGTRYWPTITGPQQSTTAAVADPADAAFWQAVEQSDGAALAESLHLDPALVEPLLPALSSWRERRRGEAAVDEWLYIEHWKPVQLTPDASGSLSGTWLLLVPAGAGVDQDAATLAEGLGGQGVTVRRIDLDATTVDRASLEAMLAETSQESENSLGGVLSLLPLDERPRTGHESITAGTAATLLLAQTLDESATVGAGRLWCVTRGAVSIGPADVLNNPAQAAVWGLARVIGLEQPTRWGGLIDLPRTLDGDGDGDGDGDRAVQRVLGALHASGSDGAEDQLAIRDSGVYVRRLRRSSAPVVSPSNTADGASAGAPAAGWQPRGTVLITGGTGALGARMALWAAERGAEHIVLASRRGPDAPDVAELLGRLTELGATAVAVACDVADRAAVELLLNELDADGRTLRAVIHTAGLPQATALRELDLDAFVAVSAAKAAGAAHLDELLADRELDAFLVFSSIAAAWGSGGQAAYAAANAYLDALSRNRRFRGLTAHSVQWGGWAETGMAAQAGADEALRNRGIRPMEPAFALHALDRILAGDEAVRTVADMDWARFAPVFTALRPSPLLSDVPEVRAALTAQNAASDNDSASDGEAGTLRAELAGLSRAARTQALTELVRAEAASVLGHDGPASVDARRPFRELGFDSLTSLELRKRLGARTGLRLPATLVFDHPTAQDVVRFLNAELFGASGGVEAEAISTDTNISATADEPIAIVGMSCRFPGGASTPEELWQLVADQVDALGGFPTDRGWQLGADTDADTDSDADHGFARVGGFLDGADRFDPSVFGMSPREALATDPQQRLLLETAWELFERSGIDPTSLRGSRSGVYIGSASSGYASNLTRVPEAVSGHLLTGNSGSVISGRISYTFGLEGPAVTVDTACSSSLVALHMAVHALQRGECDLAVAGGATIMATPGVFVEFSKQRGLATDGRCKPFADAADGTGWGEGVGLLLVERLSDARAKGHQVLAVVRGSAVNQDGASNGLTAPNGPSQQRVIRAALASAGLSAADVDAVEAHGTGTSLGDPIEAQALLATYGQGRDSERPLWLGSIKSNIGHTQSASGVAGVIKMVEAMRHGVLPATLHVDAPSSHVDWSAGAVELLTEARPWTVDDDRPRRFGVSSFGISGTNAHVIIEQVEAVSDEVDEPVLADLPIVPWVVSARSASALADQATRLASYVAEAELEPAEVGYALASTRGDLEHRAVVLGRDVDALIAGLEALAEGRESADVVAGYASADDRASAWVFTGQGSQWAGMAKQLYEAFPEFARLLDEVCAEFDTLLDFSVRDALLSDHGPDVDQTGVAQPAIFAVEVALAGLLRSWGMSPEVLAGHSIGEFAAAYVAGVFSLSDACRLVAARGGLMQALPSGGAMLAVAADWTQVESWIDDGVWLAAVNAPGSVVVSGERAAVELIRARCEAEGVRSSWLRVSHAFHSGLMDPMLAGFRQVAERVTYQAPSISMVSTVTGRLESEVWCDPSYWVDQVRSTVRFADAVSALRAEGAGSFVEIGPDAVLTSMIARCLEDETAQSARPVMRRDRDNQPAHLLHTLASLHVGGVGGPDWAKLFFTADRTAPQQSPRHHATVALPTYAFQRERYWLEGDTGSTADLSATGLVAPGHPLLGAALPLAGDEGAFVYSGRASAREHAWLAQHVVDGVSQFLGAAFVEMARSVGDEVGCPRLDEVVFESSPVLPADGTALFLQLTVGAADASGSRDFTVYSRPEQEPAAEWQRHARGVLSAEIDVVDGTGAVGDNTPSVWPPAGAESVPVDELYPAWAEAGFDYGPALRGLRAAWRLGDEAFAEVELDESLREEGFGLHPALLESSLHVLALGIVPQISGSMLPFAWSGVSLYADGATRLRVRITPTGRAGTLSVRLADAAGLPVATVDSLSLRAVQSAQHEVPEAVAAPEPEVTSIPAPARPTTRRTAQSTPVAEDARDSLVRKLESVASPSDQDQLLSELVCARTAAVLGHRDADGIEAVQPFKDLGVSSLTAVELRDGLAKDTGLRLPATLVFDYPTPQSVAALLKSELLGAVASKAVARAGDKVRPVDEALDPIVIVGMACRFPGGANTPEEFWDLVAEGRDAISPLPTNRGWPVESLYHPDPDHPGTYYNTGGGFLHNAGEFDPAFFGISPREALSMDPQHRILLEIAWETLESAGIDPATLRGTSTGVFAGIAYQDYTSLVALSKESAEGMLGSGSSASVLTGRIAYTLGLEGPAVTVDTACSSSLVALHWACQAIRNGDCTLALAGGVTVMATPVSMIEYSRQRALAPDGRCKPFAEAADGASWAEGAGLLLVERLSDARANGHPVLAVVRGSAVNQDGASNGMTAPNGPAQQRVIRAALASAGLGTADVDAVEAHGTGTTLGDPIEAQAVLATYGQNRGDARPLWLGSVKSNIGHAQAAAGVAGIIKTVLAMRHGLLPRTLHIDTPSSHVDWMAGEVELLTSAQPWPRGEAPRRAGVSAFGVSGTNAHVIIEEPDPADQPVASSNADTDHPQPPLVPWVLSARTTDGVRDQAARLLSHLTGTLVATDLSPTDIGRALASTRSAFEHRAVVIGADREELLAGLDALAADRSSAAVVTGTATRGRTAWVFTGQGAQWAGMGRRLHDDYPVFAAKLDEVCAQFDSLLDVALLDVILNADSDLDINQTGLAQPAIFAVEVALAELLASSGVRVDSLAGHSIGEFAAAYVAGVFSLPEACRLIAARGQLMQALPSGGAMLAVGADWARVESWIGEGVWLAAVNAPGSVVVSGERAAVEQIRARCEAEGVRSSWLRVSHAFHSGLMDPMLDEFRAVAESITYQAPSISMVSTVTGRLESELWCTPDYWVDQVRSSVRFADAVSGLRAHGVSRFVEVGPDAVLSAMIERCLDGTEGGENALVVPVQRREREDRGTAEPAQLLRAISALHTRGAGPDWSRVLGNEAQEGLHPSRVPLPTYAFQRRQFWPTIELNTAEPDTATGISPEDRAFWSAIESGDLSALAETLGIEGEGETAPLAELVPTLATWRRRGREQSTIAEWTYRVAWTPLASSRTTPTSTSPGATGTWLLVTSADPDDAASEVAHWLTESMTTAGAHVVPVEFDVRGPVTAAELMGAALDAEPAVAGVISLLGLDGRAYPEHPGVSAGLALTMQLTQTLGELDYRGARLWALTRGAVSVGPADPVGDAAATQSGLWGFGRAAALEFSAGWGGLVDLPGRLDARAAQRLITLLADSGDEDQLAVRDSAVFARRLAHHASATSSASPAAGWQPSSTSGTVLITGGTGALGGHVARWLAGQGAHRLVLTSRRGLAAPGAAELVAELEALGAGSVLIEACDIADREQLAQLIARVEADAEPISAVVHAAGVPQSTVLSAMTLADFESVYAAKAAGALHLDELLGDRELEAFITFSSIAGVWGSGGQAAYAAGNAVVDGLAERRRARGRAATSVAWGPWAGGGMSSTGEGTEEYLSRRGLLVMAPETAVEALHRALGSGEPALVVADVKWDRFAPGFTGSRPSPLLGDLPEVAALLADAAADPAASASGTSMRERLLALAPAERLSTLLNLVLDEAAVVLGHANAGAVAAERPFNELGFDSLTAIELRNKLNAATGLRLTATVLFDYPDARILAEHLRTELVGDADAVGSAAPLTGSGAELVATHAADDPVVIVGMGCRYPGGVSSPRELWQLVSDGADALGEFPTDRGWDLANLFDPDPDSAGHTYVREAGFLYEAGQFDAGFFGISPREAYAMDPQQRLLLETTWETFENAGIDPSSVRGGRVGVFAGTNGQDYIGVLAASGTLDEGFAGTGNTAAVLSGRISYTFGFEGPAVTVDTACSSSLVALHMAVQALQRGECDMALAGGITVMSTPGSFAAFSRQRGLAADGRVKAFAEAADGTGWGEGVGLLLVERLSDARAKGHQVLAVVRGSAINQDGASNGLTAPNGPSQQRVIRAALASAGLNAADVDVVEAHGTGTSLGDPIEAQALLATYGQGRRDGRPLWLGSIKSNIGHTQAASGVAGVIKMVEAMQRGVLPKSLHIDAPSSHVDWSAGAVELLMEARPWTVDDDRPRRFGVSSFGISGTNAHVIIEQAEAVSDAVETPTVVADLPVVPWVVSARSAAALADQAARLASYVAESELDAGEIASALAFSRSAFDHRAVVVGSDREELVAGLRALAEQQPTSAVVTGVAGAGRTAWVFTGQGSQWAGMGGQLYDGFPEFARLLDEVCAEFDTLLDFSVRDALLGDGENADVDQTGVAQPAIFAVEVALAGLLRSWGMSPEVLAGHSIGEFAAAYVAGVFSLSDACRLVAARGSLMQALPTGGVMLAVGADWTQVESWIGDGVWLAAVNAPGSVVVSGEKAGVDLIRARCEAEGVRSSWLRVSHAFHSGLMDPMLAGFRQVAESVTYQAPVISMVSTVTGGLESARWCDPDYWVDQVRSTVRFADAVAELRTCGALRFVEIGPDAVLTSMLGRCFEDEEAGATFTTAVMRRDRDSQPTQLMLALAGLHTRGTGPDWARLFATDRPAHIQLPTYAFEHAHYWPRRGIAGADVGSAGLGTIAHPLLGAVVPVAGSAAVVVSGRLSLGAQPWLADHTLPPVVVFPGTGFVELAVRAGDEVGCGRLEELTLVAPLVLPERGGVDVQIVVAEPDEDSGSRGFEIYALGAHEDAEWTLHGTGTLAASDEERGSDIDLSAWPPPGAEPISVEGLYASLAAGGITYGPAFQGLRAVWRDESAVYAEVALGAEIGPDAGSFGLHPALLDAALHAVAFAGIGDDGRGRLPFAWSGVELYAAGAGALRVRMTRTGTDEVSLEVADTTGAPLARVDSLVLRAPGVIAPQDAPTGGNLQEVAWTGMPVEPTTKHQRWAALGASSIGAYMDGIDVPVHVESYDDLRALADAVRVGSVLPPAVMLSCLPQDRATGPDAALATSQTKNKAEAARSLVSEVLAVLQTWLADDVFAASRLVIVTSGAVGERVSDPAGTAVWGLVRSAISENPGRFALADLDDDARSWSVLPAVLAAEWPEAVIREGAPSTSRLRALDTSVEQIALPDSADTGWQLAVGAEATLDGLHAESNPDLVTRALTAGQVRVGVRSAGVNFRDVLTALGMYPGPSAPLGQEGAGVVLEVGPGVEDLVVGDRVFGMFPGAFGPTAIADRRLLERLPEHWSFAQGASVPLVYLTAYYALVDLANLRPGERVLIHAAAGGVGMAAVQLAKHLGAEVYGTASAGKWDTLESLGIDGAHRASSRDLTFAESFDRVDVVLNSLAGPFVDASLGLLGAGGRFVEMGKTDVREPAQVAAQHEGVGYQAFDLFDAGEDRIREMFGELLRLFETGALGLSPLRCWPIARAREAFRFVSQAKHIGKVALNVPAPWNPDGTVLITGGTGGLGGVLARHLVTERGVRSLVLTSRRGLDAKGAPELVAELKQLGATDVRVEACDVSQRAEVRDLLSSIGGRALTAIVHTAGVIDDATIGSLRAERVGTVFGPKADGAVHLAELTEGYPNLAAFVVFSSASGVLGGAGQGNYAAANAFLDGYAAERSALGLGGRGGTPIHSIAWGAWHTGAGMTAGLSDADVERMGRTGLIPITAEQGMAMFEAALLQPRPAVTALNLDLGRLSEHQEALPPILHGLAASPVRGRGSRGRTSSPARRTAGTTAASRADLAGRLAAADQNGRLEILLDLVRGSVAGVLGLAGAEAVTPDQRLSEIGFDSLTAVELRNLLGTQTGLRLPSTLVFDYPTATELAQYLNGELAAGAEADQGTGNPASRSGDGASGETAPGAPDPTANEEGITALFRTACTNGRIDAGFELIGAAAQLRPTFSTIGEFGKAPVPVKLTSGPADPVVICISSFVALAGVHQYARLAAGFRGVCDVWALSVPGFVRDEPLPADLDAVIGFLAAMARDCADGRPFVLMGSSGGGLLAHAVAEVMERTGPAPAGVVLLDTYETTENSALTKFEDELITGMFDRGDLFVPMDATRLTAMSWYFGLVGGWVPRLLGQVPSLLVRAGEPLGVPGRADGDEGAAPLAKEEWQSAWKAADEAVDVPGTHFTMMERHSATTARAVLDWIGRTHQMDPNTTLSTTSNTDSNTDPADTDLADTDPAGTVRAATSFPEGRRQA